MYFGRNAVNVEVAIVKVACVGTWVGFEYSMPPIIKWRAKFGPFPKVFHCRTVMSRLKVVNRDSTGVCVTCATAGDVKRCRVLLN